jgi:hypothetical protein
MTRYLRIAGAVMFALLAWVMTVLWVRSYSRCDLVHSPSVGLRSFSAASNDGVFSCAAYPHDSPNASTQWHVESEQRMPPLRLVYSDGSKGSFITRLGFVFIHNSALTAVSIPHWSLVVSSFALAAALGLKRLWRFTVRGLLIATTILATALGLAVWAV